MSNWYERYGKRILDITLSSGALLATGPTILVLSAVIRAEDQSPALFRQKRVGRDGKEFIMLKLRSMSTGVGDIPSGQLVQAQVTKVGRFIRRTNLDELPQLINILKGDMSIVGPRPPLASQEDVVALRATNGALKLRPGLTGLAQVNSYDGMTPEHKAHFDGEYANTVSLKTDLFIILKTFGYLLTPPPKY